MQLKKSIQTNNNFMFLQIFKKSQILDTNNNIQIADATYMVCWTYSHFLHLNKLLNIWKLLVISSTQGSTIQDESSMALLFSSHQIKKGSTALLGNYWSILTPSSEVQHFRFPLEFAAKCVNEREGTHTNREICVSVYVSLYLQNRVKIVEFLVAN